MTPVNLRRADAADAAAAAEVWLRARRAAVPVVPAPVHPDAEVRQYFQTVVVPTKETWLAEVEGGAVAVLVLDGGELDQLYVDPAWQGRGIGSRLVRLAQARRPEGLALWTFQANLSAQRFYERHGFVAVAWTDGSANEERAPDVRYVWGGHRERPSGSRSPKRRNPDAPGN
jgi:ribosomal protein S18 acetylase RimI-like enzyme